MPKILIVEDDPAVRDVVEHALSREGMVTQTAGDGEAALKHLREEVEPFDLVVLDVMLPGWTASASAARSGRARPGARAATCPS